MGPPAAVRGPVWRSAGLAQGPFRIYMDLCADAATARRTRASELRSWGAQTQPRAESRRFAGRPNKCTPRVIPDAVRLPSGPAGVRIGRAAGRGSEGGVR